VRVAVVGGTGFIGRRVAQELPDCVVLSRRTGFDACRPDPGLLRGAGAVVNLAGIARERGAQTFEAVHVDLVRALVAAMKAARVARLVHVSVVAARPDPARPYADTKYQGERVVRDSGLDWTILRPSVVYGEGDDLLSKLVPMLRAGVFPLVGRGAAPMMPVDVADVARAVALAIDRPEALGQSIDVLGSGRLAYADLVRVVAEAAEMPALLVPTPPALLRLGAAVLERVLPDPPATSAQVDMLTEGLAGDPAPARDLLGLEPAAFSVDRIRRLVPAPARDTPAVLAVAILAIAAACVAWTFRAAPRPWLAMTATMTPLLLASLALPSVRRRARPTLRGAAIGLAAAVPFFAGTLVATRLVFPAVWPGFAARAGTLYAWMDGYPIAFLLPTLAVIVAAEEAIWRGLATRLSMERLGRWPGVLAGAAIYAVAHVATGNPLIVFAAAAAGLWWSWLHAATDDLVAPFVCHFVWDVLLLFAFPIA